MNEEPQDVDENTEDEDFAALFAASLATGTARLEPGQKIAATVLQIGAEWVFLDVGQKGEGIIAASELLNTDGEMTVAVGDPLNAYFVTRKDGELRFTLRLGGGSSGTEQLEDAWRSGVPVEGRIEEEIKGGFAVRLPGAVRAFCPFSQLGLRREENVAELIGSTLTFKITQFGEQGRNIVVSHRAILEEERRAQREVLRATLKEGMVVSGTVTNIREFGAFIDIGGIEGLLPISEIGYGRVENINEVLHVGQELQVALKSCDWEKERFAFSLRDTLADPWQKVGTIYREGSQLTGTVSRLTQFGAFVTLEDGIDGLVHISKLGGGQRIRHPQDVLKVGQALAVTIEKIDLAERRIALIPTATDVAVSAETSWTEQAGGGSGLGSLGDLLQAAQKEKKIK
ncbi:MAG: 30S ribosomal protein S1 [Desulfuromonadales bacterium]|nr:30S ribosomal protein S1 [Desulfuromonadales bacterium]